MVSLRVGTAKADCTPDAGVPLMGHLREDYASTGVHDPLYAKAAVFAGSDGLKVALVAVDVCMLGREQVDWMRREIAGQCDIPREHILIAATHIHSGPATRSLYAAPAADAKAMETFLKKAARAAVRANAGLADGTLRVGYASEDRLSFYRRLGCRDGKVHMNWETLEENFVERALGEIDPRVTVVAIERAGRPQAALVNFALHPAILDYGNTMFSAEYPGFLAEAMRKVVHRDFETIFFNGCCGNINHLDYVDPTVPRRGYAAAQRVGYMLAASAAEALEASGPVSTEPIAVSSERVALKRMRIDEETYQWSLKALQAMEKNPVRAEVDGLPREYSAPTWIEMYRQQDTEDQVEVMAIRIGDIGIVGLPGEVFCEFGMQIRERSPARHTVVVALANDDIGYLPTSEAFDQEGGYEVTPGATRYDRDAGERLTASALNQLWDLFGA
jgi:hypothetical protein